MKRFLVLLVMVFLGWGASAGVSISNLSVAQRAGTKLVDIRYDISNPDTPTARVSLAVSNAGVPVNTSSVTGSIGSGVTTGTARTITWNMAVDWNGNVATLQYTVTAVVELPPGGDSSAVSWVVVSSRWVRNTYANGDVTMSDRTTRLMWVYNANAFGLGSQTTAHQTSWNLGYGDHGDWVLPDKDKLSAVALQSSRFINVQTVYWSSSIPSPGWAYVVWMPGGGCAIESGMNQRGIWPCRAQ